MEKELREVEQELIRHMEAITSLTMNEIDINEQIEELRSQKKTITKAVRKLMERLNNMRAQAPSMETVNVGSEE